MRSLIVAPLSARTWRATTHLILGAPIGAVTIVMLAALVYGTVSALTVVGLPLLAVLLHGPRLIADVERWRARRLLKLGVPNRLIRTRRAPGFLGYVRGQLTDRATWRLVPQLVIGGPLEVVQAALTLALWGESLLLLTWPLTRLLLSEPVDVLVVAGWKLRPDEGAGPYLVAGIGLVGVVVSAQVVRAFAAFDRWRLALLLRSPTPDAAMAMTRRRDQAVHQAHTQLRRLERDLHDGAQARMVALALELGRVREELPANAPQANRIAVAHEHAKTAITELRDLARGIYPAVLVDSGLDGALPALAERLPIPLTIDIQTPRRPSAVTESTIYLCATELVTNAVKHSQATTVQLSVQVTDTVATLTVSDDGVGGANARPGGGLAGLVERAHSVGGNLRLDRVSFGVVAAPGRSLSWCG
ncbi:sensor histidine kinase [Pilimelia columellifera]|uniref:histidine kinase n=1 Tax=Pilimelia columellifera subsp. columellifera TaxID=706583 RepID=A0ABP6B663_9ACTN